MGKRKNGTSSNKQPSFEEHRHMGDSDREDLPSKNRSDGAKIPDLGTSQKVNSKLQKSGKRPTMEAHQSDHQIGEEDVLVEDGSNSDREEVLSKNRSDGAKIPDLGISENTHQKVNSKLQQKGGKRPTMEAHQSDHQIGEEDVLVEDGSDSEVEAESSSGSPRMAGKQTQGSTALGNHAHQVFDEKPQREKDLANQQNQSPDSSYTLGSKDTQPNMPDNKWADLFSNNSRAPSEGVKLKVHEGSHGNEVSFSTEEPYADVSEAWGSALIGYIAGRFPGKKAIAEVAKTWGHACEFYIHHSGWLIFDFSTVEGRNAVLEKGPQFVFNRPLLLKTVPPFFRFDNDEIVKVPIWVRLPSLPLELWNAHCLGKILSTVGTPIRTDSFTAKLQRRSFARALVEVDVSEKPIKQVKINLAKGDSFDQEIQYEYIPPYCHACHVIGHTEAKCAVSSKQSQAPPKKPAEDKGKAKVSAEPTNEDTPEQQPELAQGHPDATQEEDDFQVVGSKNKARKGSSSQGTGQHQPAPDQTKASNSRQPKPSHSDDPTQPQDQARKIKGKDPRAEASEKQQRPRDKNLKIGGNHPPNAK